MFTQPMPPPPIQAFKNKGGESRPLDLSVRLRDDAAFRDGYLAHLRATLGIAADDHRPDMDAWLLTGALPQQDAAQDCRETPPQAFRDRAPGAAPGQGSRIDQDLRAVPEGCRPLRGQSSAATAASHQNLSPADMKPAKALGRSPVFLPFSDQSPAPSKRGSLTARIRKIHQFLKGVKS